MLYAYINILQGTTPLCISRKKQSNINKQPGERKPRKHEENGEGGGGGGQEGKEGIMNSTGIPCMYDFVGMNTTTMRHYKLQ